MLLPFLALLEVWRRHGVRLDADTETAPAWMLTCGCVLGWEDDRPRLFPATYCCPSHGQQQRLAGLFHDAA